VPTRRYTVHRRDGTSDEVDAEGMWPEAANLVFRYTEVVIMQPRELVALRVPIVEVERVRVAACPARTRSRARTTRSARCGHR
jgi:hypothetical protein